MILQRIMKTSFFAPTNGVLPGGHYARLTDQAVRNQRHAQQPMGPAGLQEIGGATRVK